MKNLNVVVIGANRGIGFEYCKQLKEKNNNVIAVCRTTSEELDHLSIPVLEKVDIAEDSCIEILKKYFEGKNIDLLICNAGILQRETIENFNFESIALQFQINAVGYLRVIQALLPNLKSGSKIVFMTSRMGSIEDNSSGSRYGYRMSKAALNAAGKSLSIDLKPKNIAVAILHPGFVKTQMTRFSGNLEAPESATMLIDRISELTIENSGNFWHANGEILPW